MTAMTILTATTIMPTATATATTAAAATTAMVLAFGFAALVACATAIYGLSALFSRDPEGRAVRRLREVTQARGQVLTPPASSAIRRLGAASSQWGGWLRAHFGLTESAELRQRFARAGMQGVMAADLYQASRIVLPAVMLLTGLMVPWARAFWMLALPAVAYLVPDFVLTYRIRSRRLRIRRSVPDVIDLLVICVEAGLGLDQAMLRVAEELSLSHPDTNEEILQINREQRAGRLRAEAWQGMADRVNIPEIDALVNMLLQTERFGTPIARALGAFATAVRTRRRQAAEELAAKSTIKIIFPLVLCIFPAVFIVLLGPAALNMVQIIRHSPH